MFDIGARFGLSLKHFANNVWKIFSFEPDSSNREGLVEKFRNEQKYWQKNLGLSADLAKKLRLRHPSICVDAISITSRIDREEGKFFIINFL
jgi:hypothetical protein